METVRTGLGILGPTLTIVPFCYHKPNRNPGIEYATEEDELLDKLDGMDIDGDGEDPRMMWLIHLPKNVLFRKNKRPDLVLTCLRTSLGTHPYTSGNLKCRRRTVMSRKRKGKRCQQGAMGLVECLTFAFIEVQYFYRIFHVSWSMGSQFSTD